MPTKNSDYWKQRFDQVEQSANNKSVKYAKQLEKKYNSAAQQIDTQINAWYQRIAKNNEISITEARRLLAASELKEFKWTVEEYIKYGEQNAIDQSWMKELENASAKFHINRLEALKLECRQQIEQVFANGQENMFDTLADVYKDTFYRSCFEIQKGVGVGFDVSALDDNKVTTLLMKPWSVDGTNFSTKLWGNKRKLINTLDQELSRMVLTGESPQKVIANVRKAMDTSQYAAKRLVLTEQAYFTSVAQKDAFDELDVEEFEVVATLDGKTSQKCREMDGEHYPVKDMEPGVNAPPFHVFCRSTTCPYFDDEFTINDKRVAKGDDGEWYEVPANMTYKEWKNSFVGPDGDKSDLTPITDGDRIESVKEEIHNIIEGRNLVGEWQPSGDYEYVIDDIIHEQGFDGVPKIVSAEEFDEAMQKSNFYAERTYSADTQELLDEYRQQLYEGKFYVDCSTGGSQYGQGMYCSGCYDITDNVHMQGISEEMAHYKQIGLDAGRNYSYTEGITLQPDARILELPHHVKADEYISDVYRQQYALKYATSDQIEKVQRYIEYDQKISQLTWNEDSNYIDELYAKRAEATTGIEQLLTDAYSAMEDVSDGKTYHGMKNPGVLVAEMGYDAINAVGHGKSGSYTVILNRSKMIIREGGSLYGN